MRKAAGRERGGRITGWHIGHGLRLYTIEEMQRALYVRELTSEQKKLSVAQIWPMSTLVAEINRGWLPELNEDFEEMDRKRTQQQRAKQSQQPTQRFIDHYLYFPERHNADRAAEQLRFKGWQVEVKMGADEKNWLVLGKQPAPISNDIGDIRDELEDLADEFHGEYDGWGAGV